jgi:hypothetical protein
VHVVPNHRERQLLQYLRGQSWVSVCLLPDAPKTLERLRRKQWIERAGDGPAVVYRITEQGMAAKTAPVRW